MKFHAGLFQILKRSPDTMLTTEDTDDGKVINSTKGWTGESLVSLLELELELSAISSGPVVRSKVCGSRYHSSDASGICNGGY